MATTQTTSNKRPGGGAHGSAPNILDLQKHLGKRVHVKFQGGKEVVGVLRGYDQLVNLVLDEAVETRFYSAAGEAEGGGEKAVSRTLGRTICRGTNVMLICPEDGYEEIANPFLQEEGGEE